MKRVRNVLLATLMSVLVFSMSAPSAMAASETRVDSSSEVVSISLVPDSDIAMARLKLEDKGPDESNGMLVLEVWGKETDGTPYVERTYKSIEPAMLRSFDTVRYVNEKSYGATGKVRVAASFEFDKNNRTVYVLTVDGDLIDPAGISGTRNEKKRTVFEGGEKAKAEYSIEVNRNLGGWARYHVGITCNYKGEKVLF